MVISGTLSRGKNCVVRDEKYSKFWKTYNSELPSSDYQKPSCSLADVKLMRNMVNTRQLPSNSIQRLLRSQPDTRHFSLPQNVQTGSDTHPASYSIGIWGFPGKKRPGHEVDYSPPSSAKVKNEWSYTSAPPWCGQGQLFTGQTRRSQQVS
jgi:hypothetical protein